LIELYFEGDKYRELFELTDAEKQLVEIGSPRFRNIYFSRMDSIFPDSGSYKFLEFNCDSPGGAYYSDIQWEVLNNLDVFKQMSERYEFVHDPYRPRVLDTLLTAWKDAGKSGRPNIAVIGNPDVTNVEEFRLFAEMFRDEDYNGKFTDPWSLEYKNNQLLKSGQRVDLIYRRGILDDYSKRLIAAKPVIDAYRDDNVVFVNPLASKLGDNKNLLEVMTDPDMEWLFTPEERSILKEHLPWTRIIRERKTEHDGRNVDLIEYLSRNRRLFVIKPNSAYGGRGVVIGREATPAQWEATIQNALKTPHVVQEYVKIPEFEIPLIKDNQLVWESKKINVNFFTFNGRFGGGFCRTSNSSVINISAGGALVSFCVVKTK